MYKIYFNNRFINIFSCDEGFNINPEQKIYCKNKKSFDKAYSDFVNDTSILLLNVECKAPKTLFKYLQSKFKVLEAAGGIVINDNKELLVIKRYGLWDLPKGKVETNEKKKIAAVREVEEECGITSAIIESKVGKTYHTYQLKGKNIFKVTHWYKMIYDGSETLTPQTEESITEVKWVNKEEINEIIKNTYESLKPLFLKYLTL